MFVGHIRLLVVMLVLVGVVRAVAPAVASGAARGGAPGRQVSGVVSGAVARSLAGLSVAPGDVTVDDVRVMPGVGPRLGARVRALLRRGPLRERWDELTVVRGVGQTRARRIHAAFANDDRARSRP